MRLALRLARRAIGDTSPNPLVGAVLVKSGRILGRGWHRRAGLPHAEVEAMADAASRGNASRGATLYVTLEPCSTQGRTPPCTDVIRAARIRRVVVGATDPNPAHCGRGLHLLRRAGIAVTTGVLADEALRLNEAFNHWIVHRTPFVTVKAAMTLDGKIATASGESKWITGARSRSHAMQLRRASDAILVGINTILADDPSLTFRVVQSSRFKVQSSVLKAVPLRRVILDTNARTPLCSKVVSDECAANTVIVVARNAPDRRVAALARRTTVWRAPLRRGRIDVRWVLRRLGRAGITSLLVEGGGEVNGTFLLGDHAHRVVFYYAPKVLGGRFARKAVAGGGSKTLAGSLQLSVVDWRTLGADLLLTARVVPRRAGNGRFG